jgi:hypothetical protein
MVSDDKCPLCGSANLHDNRGAVSFASGCGWYIICSCAAFALAAIFIVEPIRRSQGWAASKPALDLSAWIAGALGLIAFVYRLLRPNSTP